MNVDCIILFREHDFNALGIFEALWEFKPNLFIPDENGKTAVDLAFSTYNSYRYYPNRHSTDDNLLKCVIIRFVTSLGVPSKDVITKTFQTSSENGEFSVMKALLPHVTNVNQLFGYRNNTVLHTCWKKGMYLAIEVMESQKESRILLSASHTPESGV